MLFWNEPRESKCSGLSLDFYSASVTWNKEQQNSIRSAGGPSSTAVKEELEFPCYDKWPRCDSFRPWRPPAPVSWSPDHLLLTLSAVWANQRPASWPGDQWEASSCLVPALHNPRPVPPIHISDAGTLSLRDFKLETVWKLHLPGIGDNMERLGSGQKIYLLYKIMWIVCPSDCFSLD